MGTYSGNENDFQKYFTMISAKYKVLAIAAKKCYSEIITSKSAVLLEGFLGLFGEIQAVLAKKY